MTRNDAFLCDVFEAAAELGNVPILIMGDFNVPAHMSGAIASALLTGRWFDVAASTALARGATLANTCFVRDTSVGSRIDLVHANSVAMDAVTICNTVNGTVSLRMFPW